MNEIVQKDNLILNLSFEFALMVMDFCEVLRSEKRYAVEHQLIKSGTSIGANIREAQHAESKADFIHKLKIAMKEVAETQYWLELCKFSPVYPDSSALIEKAEVISKVLSKIIITMKSKP